MQCHILAVGQRMPKWCSLACEEYAKRLQRFLSCKLIEIPTPTRHKPTDAIACKEVEGRKILQKITAQDRVIALEVEGQPWSTAHLAKALNDWQQAGHNLVFIIGGPDGLSKECIARANLRWSLSALTLPHALARVVVFEQLYRAATILAHHPYHRE